MINVGIIGAGRIGQVHAKSILTGVSNARILAIADPYMKPAVADWAESVGIEGIYQDYRKILEDPRIDAVLICASTNLHAQLSLEAIAAGKHIFCEKPIDQSIERIEEVKAALLASPKKLVYQVGFNRRYDHNYRAMRKAVEEGRIGEVQYVRVSSRDPEPPPAEYAEFHGIDPSKTENAKSEGLLKLLTKAPRTFWTVGLVQFFCWAAFLYMWTYSNGTLAFNCWGGVTDTASADYQAAGNWVGVVFAVQAVGSILWATILPKFRNLKTAYVLSLLLGAVGFASLFFIHDKFLACGAYFLIGAAWAAMLALPFTLLTNALEGNPHMGSYLGLFNCTICLPQIIAAATGGLVLKVLGSQPAMLMAAGAFLVLGALCVRFIEIKQK